MLLWHSKSKNVGNVYRNTLGKKYFFRCVILQAFYDNPVLQDILNKKTKKTRTDPGC